MAEEDLPLVAGKADCAHKRLSFGSGDYYITCECGAAWVRSDGRDQAAPQYANRSDVQRCLSDAQNIRVNIGRADV